MALKKGNMEEQKVVNTEVKETPVQDTTPESKPSETPTPSGEVVKETPKESTDRVPYSRFSEVIAQKNEEKKRADELQRKYDEITRRQTVQPQTEESDPFANLSPEEKDQTQKFIDKFVRPQIMKEISPFIQEVQSNKINKQVEEAKDLANRAGINFDERLPEVVDFLSRPENRGRLTAKEAMLSLYSDEILEKTRSKAKDEYSQETKELMEKKKLANMAISGVNPNTVIHSDEMARKQMSKSERMEHDINKAIEMSKQGIRNPKVRIE